MKKTRIAAPPDGPALQNFDQGAYHTAVNRFGIYAVDYETRHRPAVNLILQGRVHEPRQIEFILNRCGTGDIVQAGAFFGDYLPALSSGVAEEGIVWAFEPNPRSFFLAQKTIELNGITNVRLHNCVLHDEPGKVDLVVEQGTGKPLGGMTHVARPENNRKTTPGRTVSVDAKTLDEVIPSDRNVSIIQLDVEGHEIHALRGAVETVKRNRPILMLEFVPDPSELNALFPEISYRAVGKLGFDTLFLPQDCL
jgi:FkbM family methyltransferase